MLDHPKAPSASTLSIRGRPVSDSNGLPDGVSVPTTTGLACWGKCWSYDLGKKSDGKQNHYIPGWWFQIFVIFTPIWGRFPF